MLLDTNIVSYFFRNDSRAQLYERQLMGRSRYISFATQAELFQWLFLRPFSEQNRERLLAHIRAHVVLPYDHELAWTWAEMTAYCKKKGIGLSDADADAWIAATALRHGLPLVTHNRRHFDHVPGLILISEG